MQKRNHVYNRAHRCCPKHGDHDVLLALAVHENMAFVIGFCYTEAAVAGSAIWMPPIDHAEHGSFHNLLVLPCFCVV